MGLRERGRKLSGCSISKSSSVRARSTTLTSSSSTSATATAPTEVILDTVVVLDFGALPTSTGWVQQQQVLG